MDALSVDAHEVFNVLMQFCRTKLGTRDKNLVFGSRRNFQIKFFNGLWRKCQVESDRRGGENAEFVLRAVFRNQCNIWIGNVFPKSHKKKYTLTFSSGSSEEF